MPRIQGRSRNYTKKHHSHRPRGKRKQTRKNRFNISTPFDAISEVRAQEMHNKHMKQTEISTNPFGRTANEKYGIDTATITGPEILKIADRLQKKRDRRRKRGKSELTHVEQKIKNKKNSNFLEEMKKLRPPLWNKEAWLSEINDMSDVRSQSNLPNNMINTATNYNLEPIREIEIIEREEAPLINLKMGDLFSRRKSRREKATAKGNKPNKGRSKKRRKRKTGVKKKTIKRPIAGNCFTKWLEQRNRPQNTIKFTEECERMNNELDREQDRLSVNRKTKKASYKVKWNPGSNETPRERLERIIHEITGRGHNVTSKHRKRKQNKRKQNKRKHKKRKK